MQRGSAVESPAGVTVGLTGEAGRRAASARRDEESLFPVRCTISPSVVEPWFELDRAPSGYRTSPNGCPPAFGVPNACFLKIRRGPTSRPQDPHEARKRPL